jgi:hypothetical protein
MHTFLDRIRRGIKIEFYPLCNVIPVWVFNAIFIFLLLLLYRYYAFKSTNINTSVNDVVSVYSMQLLAFTDGDMWWCFLIIRRVRT